VLACGLGIGIYMYFYSQQIAHVEEICRTNKAGNKRPAYETFEKNYSVKLRGPFKFDRNSDQKQIIVCAHLTMCDTGCNIIFTENEIIESTLLGY